MYVTNRLRPMIEGLGIIQKPCSIRFLGSCQTRA
jgi:hypothetical protein